jgi:hypothetical protein
MSVERSVNCFTLGQKINTEEADYARVAAGRAAAPTSEICRSMRQGPSATWGLLAALLHSARPPFVSGLCKAKFDGGKAAEQAPSMRVPEKSFEPEATCPLDGVRIVDLSRLVSGVSLQLADFGADVFKIEDPKRGGPLRAFPTPPEECAARSHRWASTPLKSLARLVSTARHSTGWRVTA